MVNSFVNISSVISFIYLVSKSLLLYLLKKSISYYGFRDQYSNRVLDYYPKVVDLNPAAAWLQDKLAEMKKCWYYSF
jgi:hypothetical protein